MIRMPRISGKDVLATLTRNGYQVVHERASHHYLRKEGSGHLVVVPVHGKDILPPGTLASILRQAGLSPESFIELLEN
jgi:predicted RNA binding protein YcfA (HicA-like mRNA interferase family)